MGKLDIIAEEFFIRYIIFTCGSEIKIFRDNQTSWEGKKPGRPPIKFCRNAKNRMKSAKYSDPSTECPFHLRYSSWNKKLRFGQFMFFYISVKPVKTASKGPMCFTFGEANQKTFERKFARKFSIILRV